MRPRPRREQATRARSDAARGHGGHRHLVDGVALIYGAFDGMSRGKKSLGRVNDRYHQGRAALSAHGARDLERVPLDAPAAHQPQIRRHHHLLRDRTARPPTASISPRSRIGGSTGIRTRAIRTRSRTSARPIPTSPGKIDLARREASIIDLEPKKGGEVNVLAEDIESFDAAIPRLDDRAVDRNLGLDAGHRAAQPAAPSRSKSAGRSKAAPMAKPVTFVTKVTIPQRRLRSASRWPK